jgi:hypothetical protein
MFYVLVAAGSFLIVAALLFLMLVVLTKLGVEDFGQWLVDKVWKKNQEKS